MISHVYACAVQGIDGLPITVEVDFRPGFPAFTIVGLPDTGVREARERVMAAIKNSGYAFPLQRITVNLAPGHIKKEGPSFDLAIAVGILAANGLIAPEALEKMAFLGELGLNGGLRPVRGVLPCAVGLEKKKFTALFVAPANAAEAGIVAGLKVFSVENLQKVVRHLTQEEALAPVAINREKIVQQARVYTVDFNEVKGQKVAKRALEIAAAGGHNLLLIGPPGSGKTLLARRLPTILPDLNFDEALETTKIHSVAGALKESDALVSTRPFRSPHHQVSDVALVGGGSYPRPGEVSLAHRGVLFLDEFPEFGRSVLEGLRQPLEDRCVTIVRMANSVRYPSDFLLVAAANPCPCGYLGSPQKPCVCTPTQIQKYRAKMSGPLLDRIDLHIEVPALRLDEITGEDAAPEGSAQVRARVEAARAQQRQRFSQSGAKSVFENAQMTTRHIKNFCQLDGESKEVLKKAVMKLGLSARAFDRILRVARTIADLSGEPSLRAPHVIEAIGYRTLDRSAENF